MKDILVEWEKREVRNSGLCVWIFSWPPIFFFFGSLVFLGGRYRCSSLVAHQTLSWKGFWEAAKSPASLRGKHGRKVNYSVDLSIRGRCGSNTCRIHTYGVSVWLFFNCSYYDTARVIRVWVIVGEMIYTNIMCIIKQPEMRINQMSIMGGRNFSKLAGNRAWSGWVIAWSPIAWGW